MSTDILVVTNDDNTVSVIDNHEPTAPYEILRTGLSGFICEAYCSCIDDTVNTFITEDTTSVISILEWELGVYLDDGKDKLTVTDSQLDILYDFLNRPNLSTLFR